MVILYFINNNDYNENRNSDYQKTSGSAGFYAYFFDYNGTLTRPQAHLDLLKYGKTDYSRIQEEGDEALKITK